MAKSKKTVPSVPEIYHALNRDARFNKLTLCEDVHGQLFLHNSPQEINVVREAQRKVWAGFDKFASAENAQTVLTYHANIFGSEPPKKQPPVETALMVWYALCARATDRTAKTPKDPVTGRKSELLTRKYFLGNVVPKDNEYVAMIQTRQAYVCYRIFRDAIGKSQSITEADLKRAMENRAAEIMTRQDPWRIFQYYRSQLIKLQLLKHD